MRRAKDNDQTAEVGKATYRVLAVLIGVANVLSMGKDEAWKTRGQDLDDSSGLIGREGRLGDAADAVEPWRLERPASASLSTTKAPSPSGLS